MDISYAFLLEQSAKKQAQSHLCLLCFLLDFAVDSGRDGIVEGYGDKHQPGGVPDVVETTNEYIEERHQDGIRERCKPLLADAF